MDDRRRKQIPGMPYIIFPGNVGCEASIVEGGERNLIFENSMIAGLRLREWQISIT